MALDSHIGKLYISAGIGLFVVIKQYDTVCVVVKLLDKNKQDFRSSTSAGIPKGHAKVILQGLKEITSIKQLLLRRIANG